MTYRAIRVLKYGEPVVIETLQIPKPSKNQVLVKIHYSPINPVDIAFLKGHYGGQTAPITGGLEGSGVIVEVGPELVIPHKVGDRVAVTGFGTWAEYALIDSDFAFPIPAENTLEEAASSWVNPATVYLFVQTEVKKHGHKAVIHSAAASAVGKQLIRELKEEGVKSINLVRRDEYIQGLKDIGADYVLNINDPDFEANLKKIAQDEQATIALDAVGGELSGKIFDALPPGSRHLIYGGLSGSPTLKISAASLFAGKVLTSFRLHDHAGKLSSFEKQELGLKIQKKLKTTLKTDIVKVTGFEHVKEALEFYEANASKGKVLLKF